MNRSRLLVISGLLLAMVGLSGFAPFRQGSNPVDVSGDWEGELTQLPSGTQPRFLFRINLAQSGDGLTGSSRIEIIGESQYYAVMNVTGTADTSGLTFAEGQIQSQVPAPNTRWCLKSAMLRYTSANGVAALTGDWTSPGCAPGSIVLKRPAASNALTSAQVTPQPTPSSGDPIAEIVRVDPSHATLGQPIVVDFQVNGANFPKCNQTFRAPVRVLLVFDRSGSMADGNLIDSARNAANTFIGLLDSKQDEVGLLSFSDGPQIDQAPTKNYDSVRDKLAGITPGGGTGTTEAIEEAHRALGGGQSAAFVQPVILLLTDGRPNDAGSAITAAQAASADGIIVLAINAGDISGESILHQMVQNPATDYFFAPTGADLQATFKEAFQTFDRLSLVGVDVVVSERFANGYTPLPSSIVPQDGKIVGQTIEWRLPRLAQRDTPIFSYSVQPLTAAGTPFSTGQQVTYTDCNRAHQSLIAPVSNHTIVSVTDPAGLTFSSATRNQIFLGPEDRPQFWLWLGLGILATALLVGAVWFFTLRRRIR